MKQYRELVEKILVCGETRGDRTGTGTIGIFGHQMRFDLSEGFPLLTTKFTSWKNTVNELIWFLSGSTNVNDLPPETQKWWTPWAEEDGNLGTIYGEQFRKSRYYLFVQPKKFTPPVPPLGDFCGVGTIGNTKLTHCNDKLDDMLKPIWRDMIKRCYDKKSKSYSSYGAKGVHVCPEWFNYQNFKLDFKKIPGWEMKLEYPEEIFLDKDMLYFSNRYAPGTCSWISHKEQSMNTTTNTPFIATSPEGDVYDFSSIGEMARKFGMNLSAIHRCLKGKLHTHHGWSNFQYIKGHGIIRYRCLDQVKNILAIIKHNPNSRRILMNLWHSPAMSSAKLPCCHGSVIQFYVQGGKLSCHMYQRSGDVFLGVPVNIASYALMTHIFAHLTGLGVGDLVHSFGDAHLYLNHIDKTNELLTRRDWPLPTVEISKELTDIDQLKFEHLTLYNYKYNPAIKADVSI